jgi:hypothetical protein
LWQAVELVESCAFFQGHLYKLALAKKSEAMGVARKNLPGGWFFLQAEKIECTQVHDIFEEALSQAGLKPKSGFIKVPFIK